ncbi:ArsR/SmtB family transcription factor [Gluconacetobacter asukensis]|uniref:Winged helix-turn-helix transcriptional regulator n=1 Tax=Gluconacetobacter asukensis TaxID=1017181 RepID=A0A7W4IZ10_9PROT|nr:winged helix-turn-helix domain-containing protein [Gluconacetobacter asukensis]MBB2171678.1 winged helix-turn-helix transcriptional regulator [Gluconacetobacter asukensis]
MKEGPDIAHVAALIGDPARANILTALMSGKALTATELACEAGIAAPTVSGHVRKLMGGGLILGCSQGRHRYFQLAGPHVANLLEVMMGFAAAQGYLRTRPGPRDPALRAARVCYRHLAGEAGVRMYDSLMGRGFLALAPDGLSLTTQGEDFLVSCGLDLTGVNKARPPLCRNCLDWSERRFHLGGSLGRGLMDFIFQKGWATQLPRSRVVHFTQKGRRTFEKMFPL